MGGGVLPYKRLANGDVPLDGVAFSSIELLEWCRTFSEFSG